MPLEISGAIQEKRREAGKSPNLPTILSASDSAQLSLAGFWQNVQDKGSAKGSKKGQDKAVAHRLSHRPAMRVGNDGEAKETVDLLVQEHAKHPSNPVMFPSPVTGRLYGPDCLGRLHKNLLKKAGITENIPFHGLRHTFATLAIQQGVDAKTVSSILGHYSAGFTLDTYTHVTGEMQKEAAQRMGSFMAQQAV